MFVPVARPDTISLLIAVSTKRKWEVQHLVVKFAFLNRRLHEEVYFRQSEGFEVPDEEEKVYKLFKALYGLCQAPRA